MKITVTDNDDNVVLEAWSDEHGILVKKKEEPVDDDYFRPSFRMKISKDEYLLTAKLVEAPESEGNPGMVYRITVPYEPKHRLDS